MHKFNTDYPNAWQRGILLTFSLLALCLRVQSQPLLTAENTPQNESTYAFFTATGNNIGPGSSGKNVSWDFQGLQVLADTLEKYYTNNPEYNAFPDFSYPPYYFDTNTYNLKSYHYHYLITPDRFSIAYQLVPVMHAPTQACPVDKTLLEFPLAFSDSISMFWSCGMIEAEGFIRADAYGSLYLPGGKVYPDVLRVYSYERRDYDWHGTPSSPFDTVFIRRYEWYAQESEVPVFSIEYFEKHRYEMGYFWFTYDTSIMIFDHASSALSLAGHSAVKGSLKVYPQPAGESLHVEFHSKWTGEIRLCLFHISGTAPLYFQTETIMPGSNHWAVDIGAFPPGLYILELIHAHGHIATKVLIGH